VRVDKFRTFLGPAELPAGPFSVLSTCLAIAGTHREGPNHETARCVGQYGDPDSPTQHNTME